MKKSRSNLVSGLLYQVINTTMGLILPYLFITSFGSEANGLLSSVAQLFVYLDLLEAGVGKAALQALYGPISKGNHHATNSIFSATNKYYQKTGSIYAAILIASSFLYPLLIDSKIPYLTVVCVILLQGIGAVWSYFFQAKYSIVLKADGRVYVLNELMMIAAIIRNAGKILAIYLGFGIITVQFVQLLVMIMQSMIIVLYSRKKYPWLNSNEKPNYDAISQKNSVLIQQLAWVVFNHTDVLVLTVITRDLALVSVYSLYTLVFEAVQNLLETIKSGYQYKLGWKSETSKNELTSYFRKYENFYFAFSFALFTIAYVLITPFIEIYTRSVDDINYVIRYLPELFFTVKLFASIRGLNKQAVEAVGDFKKTQYIAIGEMVINILVSILLVYLLSIYGVLIGTVTALLFSVTRYIRYTNSRILSFGAKFEYSELMIYGILTIILGWFFKPWLNESSSYISLLIKAAPISIVIMLINLGVAFSMNSIIKSWGSKAKDE